MTRLLNQQDKVTEASKQEMLHDNLGSRFFCTSISFQKAMCDLKGSPVPFVISKTILRHTEQPLPEDTALCRYFMSCQKAMCDPKCSPVPV